MTAIVAIFSFVWSALMLALVIFVVLRFFHAVNVLEELNRTVHFMAQDLKDLREKVKSQQATLPGTEEKKNG